MKNLVFIFSLLLISLTVNAQTSALTPEGAYEVKTTVEVDSVSAVVLYDRAMTTLTDWAGADSKAKSGIDYQNQDTHTVIYKGRYSLGFKNTFLGDGWHRYANFTMKVRCKDGRAQIVFTVPSITCIYNKGNIQQTFTVAELADAVDKAKGKRHDRGVALMSYLKDYANRLVNNMAASLKDDSVNDDF